MDKIKNLVNPGSNKDDEVMYGSGVSDDPVHSGSAGAHPSQGKLKMAWESHQSLMIRCRQQLEQ